MISLVIHATRIQYATTCAFIFLSFFMGAYGGGFRLYPHDQERLLQFLNLCREDIIPSSPKLEWDETFNLENAAGLEASCAMVRSSSVTWEWPKINAYSLHLKHFLNTDRLPNGLIGYAGTTLGDPWLMQWMDLKTIMATQWKEDMDMAMPLILGARKVGCSVIPGCPVEQNQPNRKQMAMTVLVCVFSPGNGLFDVDQGPDPGRGDTRQGRRRRSKTLGLI